MCRFVTSVEHFYWVSFNLLWDFDINEVCVPTSKSHMELDSFSENRLASFHVIFLRYYEDLKANCYRCCKIFDRFSFHTVRESRKLRFAATYSPVNSSPVWNEIPFLIGKSQKFLKLMKTNFPDYQSMDRDRQSENLWLFQFSSWSFRCFARGTLIYLFVDTV